MFKCSSCSLIFVCNLTFYIYSNLFHVFFLYYNINTAGHAVSCLPVHTILFAAAAPVGTTCPPSSHSRVKNRKLSRKLICMRDKKTTTGNERETMTKKWTWIPHRDMASNEPRRHVQKIRLTGTPKWSE